MSHIIRVHLSRWLYTLCLELLGLHAGSKYVGHLTSLAGTFSWTDTQSRLTTFLLLRRATPTAARLHSSLSLSSFIPCAERRPASWPTDRALRWLSREKFQPFNMNYKRMEGELKSKLENFIEIWRCCGWVAWSFTFWEHVYHKRHGW